MIKKSYIFLLVNVFLLFFFTMPIRAVDLWLFAYFSSPLGAGGVPPIEASTNLNKGKYRLTYMCGAMNEGRQPDGVGWNAKWPNPLLEGGFAAGPFWGKACYTINGGAEVETTGWIWTKNEPNEAYETAEEASNVFQDSSTFFTITQDSSEFKVKYKAVSIVNDRMGTGFWYAACGGAVLFRVSRVIVNATIFYPGNEKPIPEEKEAMPEERIAYVVYSRYNSNNSEISPPESDLVKITVDVPEIPDEDKDENGEIKEGVEINLTVEGSKHQLWEDDWTTLYTLLKKTSCKKLSESLKEGDSVTFWVQPLEKGSITVTVNYTGTTGLTDKDTVRMKVEQCPPCKSCPAGTSNTARTASGGISNSLSLGSTATNSYNGSISFTAQAARTGTIVNPSSLTYTVKPDENNEVINDTDGNLKQIKTETVLVNVTVINDYKFTVSYYDSNQAGEKTDSGYEITGDPFRVITYEDPQQSTNTSQIKITNTMNNDGKVSATQELIKWNGNNSSWDIDTLDGNSNIVSQNEYIHGSFDQGTNTYTNYDIIKDAAGSIMYKRKTVVKYFEWGKETVLEVIDPDGKALTTEYQYYDQSSDGTSYGKLKAVINYDGSWEHYIYDSKSREWKTIRPFNNSIITDSEDLCSVSETTYDTENNITCYIERIMGIEISRYYNQQISEFEEKNVKCTVPGAAFDDSSNLITITKKYSNGPFTGKILSVSYPDGKSLLYNYKQTTDLLITTSFYGVSETAGGEISDGIKTISALNRFGLQEYSKSYDIRTGLIIAYTGAAQVDKFGRSTAEFYLDKTMSSTVYGCCGPEKTTDKEGTVTIYGYDSLKRLSYTTTSGITTFYSYDAMDRTVSTTVKGSDGSELTTKTVYDMTGEVVSQTDAAGHTTTYSEVISDGQKIKTTTNPDGTTAIEKYNRDGQLAEVYGTAVHRQKYEYGVEGGNLYTKVVTVGDDSSETQWVKSLRGFTTSSTKNVCPDGSYEEIFYDSLGRPVKNVGASGITVLTSYNAKGEVQYSAVDMNRNGLIDLSGPDIVTAYENSYVLDSNKVYGKLTTSMYITDGSNTPTVVSENLYSADGLENRSVSCGRTTKSITSYPEGGGRDVVVINPDSSSSASSYKNGLLQYTGHSVLGSTYYSYDAFNRVKSITRTVNNLERITTYSLDALGNIAIIIDTAGRKTCFTYDSMNRRIATNLPGGRKINYSYYPTGELKQQYGSDNYPQSYTYDAAGRMKTLMTYKYFSPHFPAQGQAVTTWNYEPQRGFLSSKIYNDGKAVSYTYNYDGSLATRTWARGITTSYAYDNAGALSAMTYSDTTPSVSYTCNRMGRPASITDASGARTLTYNADGSLATEGPVGYTYDALGRRLSMFVTNGPTTNYTYDTMSRLKTLSDGTRTAAYNRVSGSSLLASTVINSGMSDVLTVNRVYDTLDRLTNITSNGISCNYTYDNADKRTKNTLSDGSYWIYEYDDLGQITKGQKFTASGVAMWGQRFTYNYDNIGNFKDENRNGNVSKYTANSLNQYTQKTIPGRVGVSGYADANAKVTIKQLSTGTYAKPERRGMLYNKYYIFDNSVSPISEVFEVNAVKFDGAKDIVAKQTLNVFIPKTPELFTYDNDGNLLADDKYTYTWDAENRLVKAEYGSTRTEFTYDYMSRRVAKKNYLNNVLTSERKFVYDGWNLVAEYDGSNTLINSYLWGEDLSGSLQSAGGVGGLLIVNDGTRVYYPVYDGNGNIMTYLNESGSKIVDYEYGTHGECLLQYGIKSDDFAFRFSTKYFDKETDLYYYGHRYLKPDINRWLSRDPSGTSHDELNEYAFVKNNVMSKYDYLGLWGDDVHYGETKKWAESIFPEDAAKRIALANKLVDGGNTGLLNKKSFFPLLGSQDYHFNSPWSASSDTRLKNSDKHLGKAKEACSNKSKDKEGPEDDPETAAAELGISTHAYQDYYAHGDYGKFASYNLGFIHHNSNAPEYAWLDPIYGSPSLYPDNVKLSAMRGPEGRPAGNAAGGGPDAAPFLSLGTFSIITLHLQKDVWYFYQPDRTRINATKSKITADLKDFKNYVKEQDKCCDCLEYFGVAGSSK